MEGPRVLQAHERGLLETLVDNTFTKGHPGAMFRFFPTYFGAVNDENHFVHLDDGRVVSHGGMLLRWASLAGCAVRVGMVGAVAVDEAYRGRNLAWECMEAVYDKARRDGADFMLISGSRSLYLKAGARRVGRRYLVRLDASMADTLADPAVTIAPATDDDVDACREAYERKRVRFIRPMEDWGDYLRSRLACCSETDFTVVRRNGRFAGYIVPTRPREHASRPSPYMEVLEYGGDNAAIAAAFGLLLRERGLKALETNVQEEDLLLRDLCVEAGASVEERTAEGTILLLNFGQFMRRMHPFFETRLGVAEAARLRFQEQAGQFVFSYGNETVTKDIGGAVELIFGAPGAAIPAFLQGCFPIPSLAYGLSYV